MEFKSTTIRRLHEIYTNDDNMNPGQWIEFLKSVVIYFNSKTDDYIIANPKQWVLARLKYGV